MPASTDYSLQQIKLILASASSRRKQLLTEHGYDVQVITPQFDEPRLDDRKLKPAQIAETLSYFKARSAASQVRRGTILAGDTVGVLRGAIYGKPKDREDARVILSALQGTTHEIITGLTLLDAKTGRRLIAHDRTLVVMKSLTTEQTEAYLNTEAWKGKAGAYGIQDRGDAFIERIEGSFTNVVGLPMELLERMLQQWMK